MYYLLGLIVTSSLVPTLKSWTTTYPHSLPIWQKQALRGSFRRALWGCCTCRPPQMDCKLRLWKVRSHRYYHSASSSWCVSSIERCIHCNPVHTHSHPSVCCLLNLESTKWHMAFLSAGAVPTRAAPKTEHWVVNEAPWRHYFYKKNHTLFFIFLSLHVEPARQMRKAILPGLLLGAPKGRMMVEGRAHNWPFFTLMPTFGATGQLI